jgi:hypothetical protein
MAATGVVRDVDSSDPPHERWRTLAYNLTGARIHLLARLMVPSDQIATIERLGLVQGQSFIEDSIAHWRSKLWTLEQLYLPTDLDYGVMTRSVGELQMLYGDLSANLFLWMSNPRGVEAELGGKPFGWEHARDYHTWYDRCTRAVSHQLADQRLVLDREDVLNPRLVMPGVELGTFESAPAQIPSSPTTR